MMGESVGGLRIGTVAAGLASDLGSERPNRRTEAWQVAAEFIGGAGTLVTTDIKLRIRSHPRLN